MVQNKLVTVEDIVRMSDVASVVLCVSFVSKKYAMLTTRVIAYSREFKTASN